MKKDNTLQKCKECHRSFPREEFPIMQRLFFDCLKKLSPYCQECSNKRETQKTKKCKARYCQKVLPLIDFPLKGMYRTSHCRDCLNKQEREAYYAARGRDGEGKGWRKGKTGTLTITNIPRTRIRFKSDKGKDRLTKRIGASIFTEMGL